MEPTIGIIALFVFGGFLTFTMSERRYRFRWLRFERRELEPHDSPFRRAPGPAPTREVLVQHRAPKTIRRTALWSIYMGQMAVPGGLLGMVGLVVGGLGLVSIPGMILAIRIWRNGYAMLRRDPAAEQKARDLSTFAIVLNVIAVTAGMFTVLFGGLPMLPVLAVLVAYAAVSLLHAVALRRCANLLAKDREYRAGYNAAANGSQAQEMQPAA